MRSMLLACTLAAGFLAPLRAQQLAELCRQHRNFRTG